jgi:hypothetical protein
VRKYQIPNFIRADFKIFTMIPNQQKINSIKANLFYRSQDAIPDYERFDWHIYRGNIDSDKPNSSQALAIDFWGCLKLSPFKDQIINALFNSNDANWDIKFEYTDSSLMSELRPTQIDVIIESKFCAIIAESKFAEANGGGCSQIRPTSKKLIQCSGDYKKQINPVNGIISECALSGKEILYWNYIDTLTKFDKNSTYPPCPFKNGEYQWMRNICFAEAYSKTHKKRTLSYLVYYKSDKCPISVKVEKNTYLGKLKDKILNTESLKPISYNNLLSTAISLLTDNKPNEKKVWIDLQKWMAAKEKYLHK